MAGAGYRNFTPNEVLTADQVQNFLMDQSVMVFDDADDRDESLIGIVAEGMLCYLKDTNEVQVFDASEWLTISEQIFPATSTTRGTVFGGTTDEEVDTSSSVALGRLAGTTDGSKRQVAIGGRAGGAGDDNVFVGYNAGRFLTSDDNVIIGSNAVENVSTNGGKNVVIGYLSHIGDADNVFIGHRAGLDLSTSERSVAIGSFANTGMDTRNSTVIGYSATPSADTADNEVTLGNSSVTTLRCATGSITTFSDRRDKKNIEDLDVGLNLINELKPVKFDWDMRDGGKVDKPDSGFIAQDIIEAEDKLGVHQYLQLSMRNNEDRYEVSASRLIPVLVNAVKELSAEVEALKAQISEL